MVTRALRVALTLLAALTLVTIAGGLVVDNADMSPTEVKLLFAMREYTLTYNEYAPRLPGWVTGPFEAEKVNLHVVSPDGVMIVGITFHDRKIVQFDAKACPDPLVTVTADSAVVEEVMHSSQPFDIFREAMRNGTVTIEGETLLGTLRSGMVWFGLRVMDLLRL